MNSGCWSAETSSCALESADRVTSIFALCWWTFLGQSPLSQSSIFIQQASIHCWLLSQKGHIHLRQIPFSGERVLLAFLVAVSSRASLKSYKTKGEKLKVLLLREISTQVASMNSVRFF